MNDKQQLPLTFQRQAPFVANSATSAQAAADIVPHLSRLEAIVLQVIANRGLLGATDDEVECLAGLRHQTASARRRALVLKKFVKDSGQTRATRSGRRAVVWVAFSLKTPFDPQVTEEP